MIVFAIMISLITSTSVRIINKYTRTSLAILSTHGCPPTQFYIWIVILFMALISTNATSKYIYVVNEY